MNTKTPENVNSASTTCAQAGHNGGPPLNPFTSKRKIERIKAVLDRDDLTTAQKLVGVAIVISASKDGQSSITTKELQNCASVKDRETVFRATRALSQAELIQKESAKGQRGVYRVLSERVVDAVIEAFHEQQSGRVKPDGSHDEHPVGLRPTSSEKAVGSNQTGQVKPVGSMPTGRVEADQFPSRTRANKESPSEISNYEERETRTPARDVPHMNGVGFVISKQHDLVIPMETVSEWQSKYPAIPDLEAKLKGLAAVLLARGCMHPGWQCPEGWMANCLSDDNAKAEANAEITKAKVDRAKSGGAKSSRPSYMFR